MLLEAIGQRRRASGNRGASAAAQAVGCPTAPLVPAGRGGRLPPPHSSLLAQPPSPVFPQAMGRVVMAMKRFSNSLNPTYTYGKRPSSSLDSGSRRVRAEPLPRLVPCCSALACAAAGLLERSFCWLWRTPHALRWKQKLAASWRADMRVPSLSWALQHLLRDHACTLTCAHGYETCRSTSPHVCAGDAGGRAAGSEQPAHKPRCVSRLADCLG